MVKEKGNAISQLASSKEEIDAAVDELKRAIESVVKLEGRSKLQMGINKKDGKVDCSQDFFGRPAFLTVSGQLQLEAYACGLGDAYTFEPTFRAENSHTSRHLAEFWMVEPELVFADLTHDMNCAEKYVKYLCQWLLDNCREDMEFFSKHIDKTCIECLTMVASTPFARISYTEAVELLIDAVKKIRN